MRAKPYFQMPLIGRRFWALLAVLFGLMVWPTMAADSLYENNADVSDPIPIPDATNFVNTGTFDIDDLDDAPYQTRDTLNYTNTGDMYSVFGFDFDDYSSSTGLNSPADNFDNENTIEGDEQLFVWASNIVNPGWMTVGYDLGLMQFSGDNLNLADTTLLVEGGLGPGDISLDVLAYGVGTDTKGEWDPYEDLLPSSALSSYFNTSKGLVDDTLDLPVSTPYFYVEDLASNDVLYLAAFVENLNGLPAITNAVCFKPVSIGGGLITVQWTGIYTNYATGQILTNYLYLNDSPELTSSNGINTVTVSANNLPDNYIFEGSATPLAGFVPTAAGFQNIFIPGTVTNNYSYVDAQFIPTTVTTNSLVATNVSAIGGRVMIQATNELNLFNSQISGENYMRLYATNELDGGNNTPDAAPYSDINVAVTNGNLVVSNLLSPSVPVWGGTCQAWTTRWLVMTSNTITTFSTNGTPTTTSYTVTNDFRVLLVQSDLTPTVPSQAQTLSLTGTNSVVINDAFNVSSSLYINAQNLTLTTNGLANGADSLEGELNLESDNILWPSSLPNVHWLTNDGAITLGNLGQFGSSAPTFFTNVIPASTATATLSEITSSNMAAANTITIGTNEYAFYSKITNSKPDEVEIGGTLNGSMSNLIAAVNGGSGSGTTYSSSTKSNSLASASVLTNDSIIVTAASTGAAGNLVAISTTATNNLSWAGLTSLAGGADAVTNITSLYGPYGAFLNNGTVSADGTEIYANYFENGGSIYDGSGSFTLAAMQATFTNGYVESYYPFQSYLIEDVANGLYEANGGYNGNISVTANNMVVSNAFLIAGGGIILDVTNSLSDTGPSTTNVDEWYVEGGSLTGLSLLAKPASGDLLGTMIYLITPTPNKVIQNYWAGANYGVSTAGYTNNEAIGQLILDVTTPTSYQNFSGPPGSVSNAIYVDQLELEDYASLTNVNGSDTIPTLTFNTNLVIYYADALGSSEFGLQDISYELNGANDGHLIWVPQYTGYFSSTNMVYPNGTTNTLNIGLVEDPFLDSNGSGTPNDESSDPIFESSQVNFKFSLTNVPPEMGLLTWDSIPSATNSILYTTNLMSGDWTAVTNFVSPATVPPVGGWPITNSVVEMLHMTTPHGYYRVRVSPNNADVYGQ